MQKETQTLVSAEEYLRNELTAPFKSEYQAGEVLPLHRNTDRYGTVTNMAGAQPAHNILVGQLIALLNLCLEDKDCLVFPSDQLLHVPACEKFTYPDVTVVCQEPTYKTSPGGLQALCNPDIIIEVLSRSTEDYDRGEKFECYQTLAGLRQYVLVASFGRPKVEVFTRKTAQDWDYHIETDPDGTVQIGGCTFALRQLYKKVQFGKITPHP